MNGLVLARFFRLAGICDARANVMYWMKTLSSVGEGPRPYVPSKTPAKRQGSPGDLQAPSSGHTNHRVEPVLTASPHSLQSPARGARSGVLGVGKAMGFTGGSPTLSNALDGLRHRLPTLPSYLFPATGLEAHSKSVFWPERTRRSHLAQRLRSR